ncbi:hypothetical protein B0I35DRAFT_23521 [Stachybotrys elegans]|uniref:Uncharacterized protein n=1 Tax=Stachybotrys elegans TaxID=80388 RepID=A0A8K0WWX8_9HYPO|nr:hypothetical protein B0I35DRAFT_23521 [Stachybotrys elegans]
MRRTTPRQLGSACQVCASVPVRSSTTRPFLIPSTLVAPRISSSRAVNPSPLGTRLAHTSSAAPKVKKGTQDASLAPANPRVPGAKQLAAAVETNLEKFLSLKGLPGQHVTNAMLDVILRDATALHGLVRRETQQTMNAVSRLAKMGAERTGAKIPINSQLTEAVETVARASFTVVTHPNVEMTSEVLERYVQIQAQIGRPESLPYILELYASKPKPVVKNGELHFIKQRPNAAAKAIEIPVAEMALDTAIEAKHLDSALGIIQSAYCVPAFRRQKLIKHTTAPAMALAALPFGIFGTASAYASFWQNTMDITTATGIGVAGISGYFFVTGSMGLIAKLSNKDHMKRVTWTPGTPLRYRWLREEERAALDKVACAWGFKEEWRYGEEAGAEWEGLKEYMGYRQMLLDRVEFMQGMN